MNLLKKNPKSSNKYFSFGAIEESKKTIKTLETTI